MFVRLRYKTTKLIQFNTNRTTNSTTNSTLFYSLGKNIKLKFFAI